MPDIETIVARLEQLYGVPEWQPRQNPLEELIHCILSQHTSDANSFRAYRLLRERYPDWEAVARACGGVSRDHPFGRAGEPEGAAHSGGAARHQSRPRRLHARLDARRANRRGAPVPAELARIDPNAPRLCCASRWGVPSSPSIRMCSASRGGWD